MKPFSILIVYSCCIMLLASCSSAPKTYGWQKHHGSSAELKRTHNQCNRTATPYYHEKGGNNSWSPGSFDHGHTLYGDCMRQNGYSAYPIK